MNVYEKALNAANFLDSDRVPVVFSMTGLMYSRLAGVSDDRYYSDPEKMLKTQLWFHEQMPDVYTFPGMWPDFGAMAELGGMGAKITFSKDEPPYLQGPILHDVNDIARFNPQDQDPRRAEFTAMNLSFLKYFHDNVPEKYKRNNGFIEGHLFCGGPGEITALTIGYDKFFYAVYDYPKLVHELLRKVTDFIKEYLRAQMEIVGPAKRIYLWDHLPGMLSREIYAEFIHPYLHEVFDFVNDAEIKLYHNENNYPHLIDLVAKLPCNVCHVGPKHDLAETKNALNKCVMGNLHPIADMLETSDRELRKKSRQLIKTAGRGGGLWLSTAGGMAPQTTMHTLKLLADVAQETPITSDNTSDSF